MIKLLRGNGVCVLCSASFWTNPQYNVSISGIDADDDDGSGRGSVVVALMQKHRRRLRREGKTDLTIGYAVYKVVILRCQYFISLLILMISK